MSKPSTSFEPTVFNKNESVKIISLAVLIIDLSTGFSFRNYHFLILFLALSTISVSISICVNSGCSIILINRVFLLEQAPDIYIRTIISPISVRGIDSNHYSTKEYVLLEIFLLGKRDKKDVCVKITREVYLIDGLKAKILLGTDIIRLEKIDIITSRSEAFIKLCGVTVSINLKPRLRDITIKSVVVKK